MSEWMHAPLYEGRELETPCVVIDGDVVERNIAAMAEAVARLGVKLRPHAKTHKLPEMAARQIAAGAVGITVAKISEAEVMASGGIRDIFVAYPLVSKSKLDRAARLGRSGIRLIIGVDSLEGAKRVSEAALREGAVLEVRLELETGLRRTGVSMDKAVQIARLITELPGIKLSGIFTYRGALVDGASTLDIKAAGHEEGRLMAEAATALRTAGITIQDVSVGSSPTAIYAAEIDGVTEVRPGTYIYQDRMQAAFGSSTLEQCAGAVLATIVSRPSDDLIVIDGGSKTFATDVQPGTAPLFLKGFGHVTGDPDAVLERMNEEHGMIRVAPDAVYQVGDVIRIIPNHICSTVNLHSFVYIKETDGQLRKTSVAARGMLE
ncbi:alanine racemase [Paenibacillus sp. LHD-38]|uniref:alanine racemase n=1 Tax=Paenibacillus sp. LHD-38 TaxID=3072143 RepID=UPI00280FAEDB|nr:alanine racemase [Paenibacillus sp. LHD-38]MDQ8735221.1 alanine racemase [Paenibacillus sp. LHD-38]